MITEHLSTLKINKLSQAQFEREKAAGNLDKSALYLTPDEFVESEDYPGCYYRTVDGVTEWINPPMVFDVEYPTAERLDGKAVYTKAFDTGELTNSGNYVYTTESVTPIRVSAEAENHTLPYYGGGALVGGTWSIWFDVTGNTFTARFGSGMTTVPYRAQIWYTKN